jgi:hypothetical protein
MDLLLALNGFLSIGIAVIILCGDRPLRTVTPWLWLCLFGGFHGVQEWLLVVLSSFPEGYGLRMAALLAMVLAAVSLMELDRKSVV